MRLSKKPTIGEQSESVIKKGKSTKIISLFLNM